MGLLLPRVSSHDGVFSHQGLDALVVDPEANSSSSRSSRRGDS